MVPVLHAGTPHRVSLRGFENAHRYPSSASLTSLKLSEPKVLRINLGFSEKYCTVRSCSHALRRHEHARFTGQRLHRPQLRTFAAAARVAASRREPPHSIHCVGDSQDGQLQQPTRPNRGAHPRLRLFHAEHSTTVLSMAQGCVNDHPRSWKKAAGPRWQDGLGDGRYRTTSEHFVARAHDRSPTSCRHLPSVHGGLLSFSAGRGVQEKFGRDAGRRVAVARGWWQARHLPRERGIRTHSDVRHRSGKLVERAA